MYIYPQVRHQAFPMRGSVRIAKKTFAHVFEKLAGRIDDISAQIQAELDLLMGERSI